ncbi:MAG TPA: hypothetical protein VEB21_18805 [Terriglobales bacterium]|nr:hypothetical protein [Terriglobales bacterium]
MIATLLLAVSLLLVDASPAHGDWVVDDSGSCVRLWTPRSLWRGPIAIANAPLMWVRGAAGAAQLALSPEYAPGNLPLKIATTPFLLVTGSVVGAVQGAISCLGGFADTGTGGYFALLPDSWVELSVAPIPPLHAPTPPPQADPCGRS